MNIKQMVGDQYIFVLLSFKTKDNNFLFRRILSSGSRQKYEFTF